MKRDSCMRRLADGADRARVVHAHRADQRHGAELARRQPVAGGDERERVQRRQLVLAADAHEHVALGQRGAQEAEQRDAALEDRHQLVDLRQVLEAVLGEQARGAVDVERVLGGLGELGEGGREPREEGLLARAERRVAAAASAASARRGPCRPGAR